MRYKVSKSLLFAPASASLFTLRHSHQLSSQLHMDIDPPARFLSQSCLVTPLWNVADNAKDKDTFDNKAVQSLCYFPIAKRKLDRKDNSY